LIHFYKRMSLTDTFDNHRRVIIHIDIDCFYAQVEMVRDPELRHRPLGIQQKNIVVTCNYTARSRGVGKCMYVKDAKNVCPELILVNGEDLARYRKVSAAVHNSLLKATGCEVERLGMDENWVDVSRLVTMRITDGQEKELLSNSIGVECDEVCGCEERLTIGSTIARELRDLIREEHGLTCSAGVSYNKLLAKIGGGVNKPDNQTVVGPAGSIELLSRLSKVTDLPGVGKKMGEMLEMAGVTSLDQLRNISTEKLEKVGIARDVCRSIVGLAWGRDDTPVKMSGRVGIIGLEDRFMGIYDKDGVKEKLLWLFKRLAELLAEDGRQATTLKVTVRDYFKDKFVKKFSRESRQSKVAPRMFVIDNGAFKCEHINQLIDLSLTLVGKMINFDQKFHITLLGVAVTDFIEHVESKGSIKNFFSPKKYEATVLKECLNENKSTNSIATENQDMVKCSPIFSKKLPSRLIGNPRNLFPNSDEDSSLNNNKRKLVSVDDGNEDNFRRRLKVAEKICTQDDAETCSVSDIACPANYDSSVWAELPNDMKIEIIRDSKDYISSPPPVSSNECPPDIDPSVFLELPESIKKEIIEKHKSKVLRPKQKKNSIKSYFSTK